MDDIKHFIIDECDKVLENVSMRADIQQIRNEMIDSFGITKEKCFAGETPRWRTKMAIFFSIFESQWTGQGAQKDSPNCEVQIPIHICSI